MTTSRPRREPRRAVHGILLLDKPLGLSSNAALQIVKRLFNAEKAGHTGALDPLATGLLPICFGQATKLGGLLLEGDKRYRATLRLGARTSTGDAEGEVIQRSDIDDGLDLAAFACAAQALTGPIGQIPPMYSALKKDGEPLYRLARRGEDVERAPRQVTVHALRALRLDGPDLDFEVHCSKGTYVRTLAEDWAAAVGQCAHLVALRRTGAAPFDQPPLVTLAQLESEREGAGRAMDALDHHLLPLESALPGWPRLQVDTPTVRRLRNGHPTDAQGLEPGDCLAFGPDGMLLCLAEIFGAELWPRRWVGPEISAGSAPETPMDRP